MKSAFMATHHYSYTELLDETKETKTSIKRCFAKKRFDYLVNESDLRADFQRQRDICIDRTIPFSNIEYNDKDIILIRPHVQGETIDSYIQTHPNISLENLIHICLEIAQSISQMHQNELIHGSIRPSNFIYQKDSSVYLIDYGIRATYFDFLKNDNKGANAVCCGPETLMGSIELTKEMDIWKMGVLFYSILFGRPPWVSTNLIKLIQEITISDVPFPPGCDPEIEKILCGMLSKVPNNRPSAQSIYKSLRRMEIKMRNDDLLPMIPRVDPPRRTYSNLRQLTANFIIPNGLANRAKIQTHASLAPFKKDDDTNLAPKARPNPMPKTLFRSERIIEHHMFQATK